MSTSTTMSTSMYINAYIKYTNLIKKYQIQLQKLNMQDIKIKLDIGFNEFSLATYENSLNPNISHEEINKNLDYQILKLLVKESALDQSINYNKIVNLEESIYKIEKYIDYCKNYCRNNLHFQNQLFEYIFSK